MSHVRQDDPDFEERWLEMFEKCKKWFKGKDQSLCKCFAKLNGRVADKSS